MKNVQKEQRPMQDYMTLLGGIIMHMILGSYYVWSNIMPYVSSYLKNNQSDQDPDLIAFNSCLAFSMFIGIATSQFLIDKLGKFATQLVGAGSIGICIILSSAIIKSSKIFCLFNGVIFGYFSGTIYLIPIIICSLKFPQNKNIVIGVILAGYVVGSTIWIWVMFSLINPQNIKLIPTSKYYSNEITDKLPFALQVMGTSVILLSCISVSLQKGIFRGKAQRNKENHVNKQQPQVVYSIDQEAALVMVKEENRIIQKTCSLATTENEKAKSDQNFVEEEGKLSVIRSLKTGYIYYQIFFSFTLILYGSFVSQKYKLIGIQKFDDAFLNIISTVGLIVNGGSRILWGYLLEKWSAQLTLSINGLIQLVSVVGFPFCWDNKLLFGVNIVTGFFCLGGWLGMFPMLTLRIYGNRVGGSLYSLCFIGYTCASYLCDFLWNESNKIEPFISKDSILWIIAAFNVAGLVVIQIIDFHFRYFKQNPTNSLQQFSMKMEPVSTKD